VEIVVGVDWSFVGIGWEVEVEEVVVGGWLGGFG
jgi:hypothetical protein